MDIGDHGPITGAEKELYNGNGGRRIVFEAPLNEGMPDCPACGNSRRVFRACDKFVCSKLHTAKELKKTEENDATGIK